MPNRIHHLIPHWAPLVSLLRLYSSSQHLPPVTILNGQPLLHTPYNCNSHRGFDTPATYPAASSPQFHACSFGTSWRAPPIHSEHSLQLFSCPPGRSFSRLLPLHSSFQTSDENVEYYCQNTENFTLMQVCTSVMEFLSVVCIQLRWQWISKKAQHGIHPDSPHFHSN